jgi:hypothetical protein
MSRVAKGSRGGATIATEDHQILDEARDAVRLSLPSKQTKASGNEPGICTRPRRMAVRTRDRMCPVGKSSALAGKALKRTLPRLWRNVLSSKSGLSPGRQRIVVINRASLSISILFG